MIKSRTTGKQYNPDEMIYIVNPKQSAFYISKELVLYDVFESRGDLLCAFNKIDSYQIYREWCDRRPSKTIT